MSIALPKEAQANKSTTKQDPKYHHGLSKQAQPATTPLELQKLLLEVSTAKAQGQRLDPSLTESIAKSVILTPKRGDLLRGGVRSAYRRSSQVSAVPTRPHMSARQVDVNIPTAEEASSAVSSASYGYSDGSDSRSCDLDDVRSESSDMIGSPIPPTPVPEQENTEAMKERVHRELLKTLSDTEQFLRAMDQKRSSRPLQLVYSDDEEITPEEETPGDEAFLSMRHNSNSISNTGQVLIAEAHSRADIVNADTSYQDVRDIQGNGSESGTSSSTQKLILDKQYCPLVHSLDNNQTLTTERNAVDEVAPTQES